ncbi:cupin domain-containing protein [Idiomarina xiamenensis]|uniref:Cupin type-2 domain-containing protein n=1 Tax=Idiomarina xiamenensis 10-D-4 TaxID=740709 RepID=K2K8L6_9GAMM|nr:cupin domain-containing protein [Idiomarina xiamenensis]EKE82917.1 hypothetical protein A10D4_08759 [Idiomarina xiamenensis 10-D-4]
MYLSAEAIAAMPAEQKTHFLNPLAVRLNKSLGDAGGLKNIGVHIIEVAPGHFSTEFHRHHFEEECIYVLAGSARLRQGNNIHQVGVGDFISCPIDGSAHDLFNNGSETLRCLVIGQRLAQDVSDYPEKGKRLYRNLIGAHKQWDLVAIDDIESIAR